MNLDLHTVTLPPLTPSASGGRRWRAWAGTFALCLGGIAHTTGAAQDSDFVLPDSGCPMAHCDARMSDAVHATSPRVAKRIALDRSAPGAKGGLGCVSNGSLAACAGGSSQATRSNLVVYDADGNRVWDDGGILGSTAWLSAPMISTSGQVIAADQNWLLRADPVAGTVVWRSPKPDLGTPISPVLVGSASDMVFLATKASVLGGTAELSVWDVTTGALLSHQPIIDPVTGVAYATLNTPAVRGNRAYVLAAADGDGNDGRLYAIDVCESAVCGGRGTFSVVWHFGFDGPSSASPVLIGDRLFFDGLKGRRTGTYHAVDDRGTRAASAWQQSFTGRFGASAAQDPRGGIWVSPFESGLLLRLDEVTGATIQTVDVSSVAGLEPGYSPVTAVSVSASDSGSVVLTSGVQTPGQSDVLPAYLLALDVSTTDTGSALWLFQMAASAKANAATGQMPIVVNANGARRVVVKGTKSGTFFIGER